MVSITNTELEREAILQRKPFYCHPFLFILRNCSFENYFLGIKFSPSDLVKPLILKLYEFQIFQFVTSLPIATDYQLTSKSRYIRFENCFGWLNTELQSRRIYSRDLSFNMKFYFVILLSKMRNLFKTPWFIYKVDCFVSC